MKQKGNHYKYNYKDHLNNFMPKIKKKIMWKNPRKMKNET